MRKAWDLIHDWREAAARAQHLEAESDQARKDARRLERRLIELVQAHGPMLCGDAVYQAQSTPLERVICIPVVSAHDIDAE